MKGLLRKIVGSHHLGHMRVVEIKCAGKIYKRPVHKLIPLVSAEPPSQYRVGKDVQA